ncbi:hypothetical protein DVH24_016952 [Malus domestica]|uniref:Uncharacterized protein n=1 Tax=Malus domestica TaxID=3750 RepID=A0A498IRQ7_MALDO|nr:hypothetical protein DVH24_016952 [Malus domestica]
MTYDNVKPFIIVKPYMVGNAVLACSGVDKSPVCASEPPCHLPQLGRFWLGNFPKLAGKICGLTKSQVKTMKFFDWPQMICCPH